MTRFETENRLTALEALSTVNFKSPDVRPGVSARILAVEAAKVTEYGMRVFSHDTDPYMNSTPVYWLFALPNANQSRQLVAVEFGLKIPDFDPIPVIDLALHPARPRSELVSVCGQLRETIVDIVSRQGNIFFAGLEINQNRDKQKRPVYWSRLVYPRKLGLSRQIISQRLSKTLSPPDWLVEAGRYESTDNVAQAMAINGLLTVRRPRQA